MIRVWLSVAVIVNASIVPLSWADAGAALYQEPERPQLHFTAQKGWLNDPNGLVYDRGTWHLFFQHTPPGEKQKHWGHATSLDLVHWQERPIAIRPHGPGDEAFSGSGVIDWQNTTGFQKGEQPPMVLVYTSTGRGECLVYSDDGGKTFHEYEKNPVLVHGLREPRESGYWHDARDPKVFWYTPQGGKREKGDGWWVMVVYDNINVKKKEAEDGPYSIYTSRDLKTWEKQSTIYGWYECPELFDLPLDGPSGNKKWVLMGADGNYAIGAFDGKVFTPEPRTDGLFPLAHSSRGAFTYQPYKYWGHTGDYAGQVWNDAPAQRRVRIAWAPYAPPKGSAFTQMLTLPVDLSLRTTPGGARLYCHPVPELQVLQKKCLYDAQRVALTPGKNPLAGITAPLLRIRTVAKVAGLQRLGFNIHGLPVVLDLEKKQVGRNPIEKWGETVSLDLWVDQGGVEVFVDDGAAHVLICHFFKAEERGLEIVSEGGPVTLETLRVDELKTIWK